MKRWYAKKAGNEMQGLVIDEDNGHTIAVAYDRDDMNLLAAAPDLLAALERALDALYNVPCVDEIYDQQHSDTQMQAVYVARTAIARATETKADGF